MRGAAGIRSAALADVVGGGVGVGGAGGFAARCGRDVIDESLEFGGDGFGGFVVGRGRMGSRGGMGGMTFGVS